MSGETGRGGGCRGWLSRPPRKEATQPPREGLGVCLQRHPGLGASGLWAALPSRVASLRLPLTRIPPQGLLPPWPQPLLCSPASTLLPPLPNGLSPGVSSHCPVVQPPLPTARVPPSLSPPSRPLLGSGLTVLLRGRRQEARNPWLSPSRRPSTEEVVRGQEGNGGFKRPAVRQTVSGRLDVRGWHGPRLSRACWEVIMRFLSCL